MSSKLMALGASNSAIRTGVTNSDLNGYKMAVARGYDSFVSRGVGGNTTTDILARLPTELATHAPTHVLINPDINDVAAYLALHDAAQLDSCAALTKSNLRAIIQLCKASGAGATVMTPTMCRSTDYGLAFPKFLDAVKEAAFLESVFLVDVYYHLMHAGYWNPDATYNAMWLEYQHISSTGHTEIANLMCKPFNAPACAI